MTNINNHSLWPDLAPHLQKTFQSLCEPLPPDRAAALSSAVATHLHHCRQAMQRNEFLDIDLADAVANTLQRLLAGYADFSPDQQALIVGATRYFIQNDDVEPDTTSILGFDDDAQVLNYVLDAVGRSELKVEV